MAETAERLMAESSSYYIIMPDRSFSETVIADLLRFLENGPRHRLVFVKDTHRTNSNIGVDVGWAVAKYLHDNYLGNIKAESQSFIKKLIYDNISTHPQFGKYIYLRNIGVLFEPELGLNVGLFLTNLSRNTLLLLDWNGQMKYPYMYFLHTNSKHRIKIDTLNYMTL